MYKLRTVDVWDTLLRRKGHPEFSKMASARLLSLLYSQEVEEKYRDYIQVYRERLQIEAEMAVGLVAKHGEYEISAVLEKLLYRIFKTGLHDFPALASKLADLELAFELRHTFPDPDFADFCKRYPASRTLFLSDFYMSADAIRQLLLHHNLDEFAIDGISSCDVGFNKRTGTLFKYVHSLLDINPAEHIHIGDNVHADVAEAQRLGITAVHFEPESGHQRRLRTESFLTDRSALFARIADEISTTATGDEYSVWPEKTRAAFDLGLRVAPLFVGMLLYIAERSLQDRVERLFFFTREGEFFSKLWRKLFPERHLLGHPLPNIELLEVSRVSTFCPSLKGIAIDEMMRLWRLYSTQSMGELFNSLGAVPEDFEALCRQHDLTLMDPIENPWAHPKVHKLFASAEFQHVLGGVAADARKLLLQYLRERGWSESLERVGVVDIGWRGTIQDNLASVMPGCEIHGYYLGLQQFLNPQPPNCFKSAFGPDANRSAESVGLLDAVSLIEMLCNSPNGSISGYQQTSSGAVMAKRIVDAGENRVHDEFVHYFQLGVLKAGETWSGYVDSHVITSAELRAPAIEIWRRLLKNRDFDLSSVYSSLRHNEIFGSGGFVDKSLVPSPLQILQAVFKSRVRKEVILYVRQTQWAAGVWGRRDLGLIHRLMLVSILQLGKIYKRLNYRLRRLIG